MQENVIIVQQKNATLDTATPRALLKLLTFQYTDERGHFVLFVTSYTINQICFGVLLWSVPKDDAMLYR